MRRPRLTPAKMAQMFHEAYERIAPQFGYRTRRASAKPWPKVPAKNRRLMEAVCTEIMEQFHKFAGTALLLLLLTISSKAQTCDQTLWQHVYNPQRLAVQNACVSVTGTIVDASHGRNKDGARHEADGDSHNWLKLDPGQENIINAGNVATQDGNLVFEIICRYRVKQADAVAACKNFKSSVTLPPVGSHVRITGALIEDLDHKPIHREIHPVTSIEMLSPAPRPSHYVACGSDCVYRAARIFLIGFHEVAP